MSTAAIVENEDHQVSHATRQPSGYRAATSDDLKWVHGRLMEAIDTSPHYAADFKAYEKARISQDYLGALIEADPFHVMVFERNGEPAAFMISGPELGTLWLYWSYVLPEHRRSRLGLSGMRDFIAHWDNGRFHKIATYTKPGNDVAEAIMKRFQYRLVARLEQHIFGEDYLLYERALTKREPGYDLGLRLGMRARLGRRVRRLLRL
ncbi:hypothetical protein GCM10007989_07130 [Devosia pacifica]|uniref:N-acetyltransferase domain-containing protein n=1 Tax=Devosia pacifica TaxID=1335967 RepID=A0A918VND1_9HYPH|nr:GNAT family N-acetyltransferase [Devosia pacifica]GHA14972.1 hypothetical protein GCM10007989_07130 [Devosia pacifica]